MHLLETYACVAGCKIDKCFIHEEPILLPEKNYITFHGFNPKGSTRQYDKWQIVIDNLINNINFKYHIIQIGCSSDKKYDNVDTSYLGKTNYNSLAFLIKNSSLHLGYDSFPIHLASYYDIKIVGLYSHFANNTGPYFSNKNKIILFEPNDKNKPIFNEDDPLNRINTIDPSSISEAVLKLI
jgi:ADP-heptose:LPS heptosyltransferase